jgi:hypothetical protein
LNDQTLKVIDERLAIQDGSHRFLTDAQWATLVAVCTRILPQKPGRLQPVPVAALLDAKLFTNQGDGYRDARLPPLRESWQRALLALDCESQRVYGARLHELSALNQDALLCAVQEGRCNDPAWGAMPPQVFFAKRLLHDIVTAYYSHPSAWSEIGFGGPAAPRGYVRMGFDRRDPWEAVEARPGSEEKARDQNVRIR